ncbi:sigma-70 family RNA polymerase sigma factor [Streptomyces sp. NPDC018045]|uniref:sigma-70 family RNA polymerase sigma factor n=1 Tax=Streptomyces sp. NPDC018045 TaxID=3365037 RepID=UPI00378C9729
MGEDAAAFSRLGARYRAELHVHCYRMLGSFEESGELVAETLVRAWRERESFVGHATFRTWLYRVATHSCLDHLASRPRHPPGELPWLQPCPDTLLEQVAGELVSEETIGLGFVVALQSLPPRQRAVFVLRDVLGWSARETAAALGGSVAAVNSSLQRARTKVRGRGVVRASAAGASGGVLRRYVEALEVGDDEALAAVLGAEVGPARRPPPGVRCVAVRMNRQPAVALYVREPGECAYRAHGLEVLRVEGDRIAEIIAFSPGVFPAVGLPSVRTCER